jgi:hypothetical protein
MKHKRHSRTFDIAKLTAAGAVASVATLWSWNTIAELLGGPTAQFKHVVAAAFLLVFIRWAIAKKPATGISVGHRKSGSNL